MSARRIKEEQPGFEEIAEAVCERLSKNLRVRRTLPGKGRLRFDRQLPFLCLYRFPEEDDDVTKALVTSEAAYLFVSGAEQYNEGVGHLCQQISATMQEHFGTFLFLEIWSKRDEHETEITLPALQPAFEVVTPDLESLPSTVNVFTEALSEISIHGWNAQVSSRSCQQAHPPELTPLALACDDHAGACFSLGLTVRPIYRDAATGDVYPLVLQRLRSQLSKALRRAIAQFTGFDSTESGVHYEALGPSSLVKAARLVDQQLSEVSTAFDFLLQVTPTNSDVAWNIFQESHYRRLPELHYRPLPYRPDLLKRRLFSIEIERIEDPTLAHLFWEKQEEIDRQLTAMRDLGTPQFLLSSLQLYGPIDDELVQLANDILERFPKDTATDDDGSWHEVDHVVRSARDEIDHYHQRMSEFNAKIEVCDHIASGIMVSQERLLISDTVQISDRRLLPLLHHEIGTHLVTYFNGRCQPFRQLYAGLAGYEELQEGLAVMAEYLTGGLTVNRLRTLAGRVIAAKSMSNGAPFATTFSQLHDQRGFSPRRSFVTTLRAYRGGGLTKDVIYLRGLRDVLSYLAKGHDIEPLYVGKIGLHHIPYVQEMRRRGIIKAPGVLPRFWDEPELHERLEACRNLSVVELLEKTS